MPIVGFEGKYEVSDHGRVRSLSRRIPYGDNGATTGRVGRILKPCSVGKGHLAVNLGREHMVKVHLLVLEAHIGPRPNGLLGLHRDGNVQNNCLSNLYWGTYSDNNFDSVRHGTHYSASKTHCPKGHLLDGVWAHNGHRYCKTCKWKWDQDYKERERAKRPPKVRKTHCKYGHEYTPDNTVITESGRWCRECGRRRSREYMRNKRKKT